MLQKNKNQNAKKWSDVQCELECVWCDTKKEHRRYMKKDMKFQYDTRVQRDAD